MLFFIIVESICYYFVKSNIDINRFVKLEDSYPIKNKRQVSKYSAVLDKYKSRSFRNIPDQESDLFNETPMYLLKGKNGTELYRYNNRKLISKNLNDEFYLKGKQSQRNKWAIKVITNEYGYRKSWNKNLNPSHNIFTLGCSFTFGEGVENEETFASWLAKKNRSIRTYNRGVSGNAPSYILKNIDFLSDEYIAGLEGRPTIFLYLFIDSHLGRVAGDSNYLRNDFEMRRKDIAFSVIDNEVREIGTFEDKYSHKASWLHFFSKLNIVKFFKLTYPSQSESIEVFTKVLKKIEVKLLSKAPKGSEFLVVLYPGTKLSNSLIQGIERFNLKYIDYSFINLKDILGRNSYLKYDAHPSARAYEVLASIVNKDLIDMKVIPSPD